MTHQSTVPGACYFYYPRLVCVVGVRDESRSTTNFAPVTWASPLSSDPPLYGICLSPKTYTHQLVLKSGEFSISFLPHEHAPLVDRLGSLSGRDTDKVKALSLALEPPEVLSTPTLARAYIAAECSLRERHHLGDQTLFVGEIERILTLEGAFDEDGVLRVERVSPLLYLGCKRYVTTDASTASRPRELTGTGS